MEKIFSIILITSVLFLGCFNDEEKKDIKKTNLIIENKFMKIVNLMKDREFQKRIDQEGIPNGVFIFSEEKNMNIYYNVQYLVNINQEEVENMITDMYNVANIGKTACFVLNNKALTYLKLIEYSSAEDFNLPATDLILKNSIIFDKILNKKIQADGDTDIEPPLLTLNGNNFIELQQGEIYEEKGAIATDNIDGDLSNKIVIDNTELNINEIGTYEITYNVIDEAGNNAIELKRVINVIKEISKIDLDEDFEAGNFDKYSWILTKGEGLDSNNYIEERTPFIQAKTTYEGNNALQFSEGALYKSTTTLEINIDIEDTKILSFYYKTDLLEGIDNEFNFFVDDVKKESWVGLDSIWQQYSILLTEGKHLLKWELSDKNGMYCPGKENTAYLDEIKIVSDLISSVSLIPMVPQKAIKNMTEIQFNGIGRRLDNTIKEDVIIEYNVISGSGSGTITSEGVFRGTQAGDCQITATIDGRVISSMNIEVLDENYIDESFNYNGNIYNGKTTIGTGTPATAFANEMIKITEPSTANFEADGFFVIKGKINYTDSKQYGLINIKKDGTDKETSYWVKGDFQKRVWLRFGSGAYTVTVHKTEISENGENTINEPYDGDINGWSTWTEEYKFNVINTREEDGTFYYPSDPIQSDDINIYNKALELTYNESEDYEKIKKIHNWVVQYLCYDDDSLVKGARKKQDAISILNYKTAVCEGYTSLATALMRAIGIKAKAVSGDAGEPHAWNNVYYNFEWYFMDTTWDDPGPNDNDPLNLSYKYFMLEDLNGVDGDHTPQDDRIKRKIIKYSYSGYPDGIY